MKKLWGAIFSLVVTAPMQGYELKDVVYHGDKAWFADYKVAFDQGEFKDNWAVLTSIKSFADLRSKSEEDLEKDIIYPVAYTIPDDDGFLTLALIYRDHERAKAEGSVLGRHRQIFPVALAALSVLRQKVMGYQKGSRDSLESYAPLQSQISDLSATLLKLDPASVEAFYEKLNGLLESEKFFYPVNYAGPSPESFFTTADRKPHYKIKELGLRTPSKLSEEAHVLDKIAVSVTKAMQELCGSYNMLSIAGYEYKNGAIRMLCQAKQSEYSIALEKIANRMDAWMPNNKDWWMLVLKRKSDALAQEHRLNKDDLYFSVRASNVFKLTSEFVPYSIKEVEGSKDLDGIQEKTSGWLQAFSNNYGTCADGKDSCSHFSPLAEVDLVKFSYEAAAILGGHNVIKAREDFTKRHKHYFDSAEEALSEDFPEMDQGERKFIRDVIYRPARNFSQDFLYVTPEELNTFEVAFKAERQARPIDKDWEIINFSEGKIEFGRRNIATFKTEELSYRTHVPSYLANDLLSKAEELIRDNYLRLEYEQARLEMVGL